MINQLHRKYDPNHRNIMKNTWRAIPTITTNIYIYIYINKQSLEKIQLEFEIRIQFCTMDHTKIIHLNLGKNFNM